MLDEVEAINNECSECGVEDNTKRLCFLHEQRDQLDDYPAHIMITVLQCEDLKNRACAKSSRLGEMHFTQSVEMHERIQHDMHGIRADFLENFQEILELRRILN